jgi:hypothetical protein
MPDKTPSAQGERIVWDLASEPASTQRGLSPLSYLARLAATTAVALFGGGAVSAHASISQVQRSVDPATFNGAEPTGAQGPILAQGTSTGTVHCSPHHDVHADKTMHVSGGDGSDNLGNDVHIDTHQDAPGSCD